MTMQRQRLPTKQKKRDEEESIMTKRARGYAWMIPGCIMLILAGCAPTQVTVLQQTAAQVPRPDQVRLYNFAVSPDEVSLDRGISASIEQHINGTPRTAEEKAVGHQVATALANELQKRILALGFNVVYVAYPEGPPTGWGNVVEITGEFLSIDEGNRTERVVIGFGAGRTDVKALVQVFDARGGGRKLISEFDTNAASGYKPGIAETMGAGAAAGHLAASALVGGGLAVGSEEFTATVQADAKRTADDIVKKLKEFFTVQGWM
jgi:hypothetical protein